MDRMYRFDVSSIRCLRYLRIKLGVEQPLTVLVSDGPEALAEQIKRFQEPEALCRRGVNEMVLSVMFFDPDVTTEESYLLFMLAFRRAAVPPTHPLNLVEEPSSSTNRDGQNRPLTHNTDPGWLVLVRGRERPDPVAGGRGEGAYPGHGPQRRRAA